MDIFDRSAVHNNVLDATRAARLAALEATRRNVILNQLSNASDIIGEVDYPAVDENGVLRMIMSANNLLERFGISAHFAGFADDGVTPTVWIDADEGGLTALLGKMIIDADGLTIYGTTLAQYFEATEGEETRRAFLGQYLPQGETVPNFAIIFAGPVGSNLISNGDAETGDLTDWTDTDGAWKVDEDAYEGDYSFLHDGTAEAFPGHLEQNVAVTAGEIVTFAFKHKRRAGILAGRFRLDWLTSAPAVISTDYVYGNPSSGWTVIEQTFTVPATAVSVDVVFEAGDPFNDELFDDVQLYVQNVSNELRFSDDALKAIVNGTEYNLLGGDSLVGYMPWAHPVGFTGTTVLASLASITLDANGGAAAYPVVLTAPMMLESVTVRNGNSSTQRAWNWALYQDVGANELNRVAYGAAADVFTPSAASYRTITAQDAPVLLSPGVYWVVIQCTHASNNFGLMRESSALSGQLGQTKTVSVPLGATLDFVAATWTKNSTPASIRLNGRVFGEGTAF